MVLPLQIANSLHSFSILCVLLFAWHVASVTYWTHVRNACSHGLIFSVHHVPGLHFLMMIACTWQYDSATRGQWQYDERSVTVQQREVSDNATRGQWRVIEKNKVYCTMYILQVFRFIVWPRGQQNSTDGTTSQVWKHCALVTAVKN